MRQSRDAEGTRKSRKVRYDAEQNLESSNTIYTGAQQDKPKRVRK